MWLRWPQTHLRQQGKNSIAITINLVLEKISALQGLQVDGVKSLGDGAKERNQICRHVQEAPFLTLLLLRKNITAICQPQL